MSPFDILIGKSLICYMETRKLYFKSLTCFQRKTLYNCIHTRHTYLTYSHIDFLQSTFTPMKNCELTPNNIVGLKRQTFDKI